MRNNRDSNYGEFSRRYNNDNERRPSSRFGYGNNEYRTDMGREEESHYRQHPGDRYQDRGYDGRGSRDDYYNRIYDTPNYNAMPREEEYGRPVGPGEDYGDKIRHYPLEGEPFREERRHLRYSMGYNPNYDNPNEGDRYRDFDSRGNHGFRHDPAYGSSNEFRDFGDDSYGRSDEAHTGY